MNLRLEYKTYNLGNYVVPIDTRGGYVLILVQILGVSLKNIFNSLIKYTFMNHKVIAITYANY